ncbi:uncharacterized protein EDB93DRAFT_770856 [Suillus bovinus]|uniref:uncharacterized protein n=1 Tax=Suillus bovinus TaxID=48563 RepID=UPI001B87F338|nr:uncharacterized protein EDB93DRAFT_770856 [Suillus bovinus]KAG2136934.1 hypothetical protein EDB93DRAFT_770856 [Suillus bovinus]
MLKRGHRWCRALLFEGSLALTGSSSHSVQINTYGNTASMKKYTRDPRQAASEQAARSLSLGLYYRLVSSIHESYTITPMFRDFARGPSSRLVVVDL